MKKVLRRLTQPTSSSSHRSSKRPISTRTCQLNARRVSLSLHKPARMVNLSLHRLARMVNPSRNNTQSPRTLSVSSGVTACTAVHSISRTRAWHFELLFANFCWTRATATPTSSSFTQTKDHRSWLGGGDMPMKLRVQIRHFQDSFAIVTEMGHT